MKLDFEGREDHYTLLDAGDLRGTVERIGLGAHKSFSGSWYGGMAAAEAVKALSTGDPSLVPASDALLAKLEDLLPQTSKWQKINHVSGIRVNMSAHLAGLPKSMRKRKRLDRDDAPVTIFMDLTSSAMVSASDLLKRGTAILALARALVQHRPVELWGGIALGEGSGGYRYGSNAAAWSSTVAWRIDTAPLDLARAAFLLAHPAVARGIGYGIGPLLAGHQNWDGSWPFGAHDLHVRTQSARLRNAFGAAEMLVIPPIYGTDPLVTQPLEWIQRELARLTGPFSPEVGSEEWNKERV